MKTSDVSRRRTNHRPARMDDQVSDALQAVRALVQKLSQSARGVEGKTGVTNAQLFLLQQIGGEPNLTVNDLAARAMTGQSTVSIVLSRLERRGLVKRSRAPADGRSVILGLTVAGRRLLRRAPAPVTSELLDALRRLTPDEVRALKRGLAAVGRELGFGGKRPHMLFEDGVERASARRGRPMLSARRK
jgi:DNA-binding MarR family transcriptional regulator